MGLFSASEKEIDALLKPYKDQIEFLQLQLEKSQGECDEMRRAIMSIKSPDAYQDLRQDEIALNAPEPDNEALSRHNLEIKTRDTYLSAMENPLFNSVDAFEEFLKERAGPPETASTIPQPLHENNPEG